MTSTDEQIRTAIFWDIENVHDDIETHVKLTESIREVAEVVRAYAFADWDMYRQFAENLYEIGYDLIHVPDSKDNAADYKMASYILEHITRYPETEQYVLITGDGDFKLIAGALKEKGHKLWVISNPVITASELFDLATLYSDIHSFRPTTLDCSKPGDCEELPGSVEDMRRIVAVRLQETISTIEEAGNRPGIGLVKHAMSSLNPGFSEKRLGFRSWSEFLSWAEEEGYIVSKGDPPATILTVPSAVTAESLRISEEVKGAFQNLCVLVEEQLSSNKATTLESLKKSLDKRAFDSRDYGYPTLPDFIIAAEKRGFVRVVKSEIQDHPIIIPGMKTERVRAWFEENVTRYFGEAVKVPKRAFLEKISNMLLNTRTSLRRLESYLSDKKVKESYSKILEASGLPYLPPFQMCLSFVLLGQENDCSEVVTKVNRELEPLGITLQC